MRIIFVTIQYPPMIGGLTEHVRGIVRLAIELGYQTTVITAEPNPKMMADGDFDNDVIRLPVLGWVRDSPIVNPYKLYKILKSEDPDILHVVYPFPLGLDIACLYASLRHKKLVCTYIDDVIIKFPYSLIVKVYESTLWKGCKTLISGISVSTKKYAADAVGLKGWRKKLFEVPPPVFNTDFELLIEEKSAAKRKLDLNHYRKVVLFVGALRRRTKYKRLDILLLAWSKYVNQVQDSAVLLVIGDGELRPYYESIAYQYGLTDSNTIFKGYVSRETLIGCYLSGDVLVLPSEDNNEAFGIVAIEAMLYGNGIIASNIPGISGAVGKSENRYVSLVTPVKWEQILDELKNWLSRDWSEYALANHKYAKEYYNNECIKQQLAMMYTAE